MLHLEWFHVDGILEQTLELQDISPKAFIEVKLHQKRSTKGSKRYQWFPGKQRSLKNKIFNFESKKGGPGKRLLPLKWRSLESKSFESRSGRVTFFGLVWRGGRRPDFGSTRQKARTPVFNSGTSTLQDRDGSESTTCLQRWIIKPVPPSYRSIKAVCPVSSCHPKKNKLLVTFSASPFSSYQAPS